MNIPAANSPSYISGATSPGVTLQNTLLNHTKTKLSITAHINSYNKIKKADSSVPPLIFGETNSLYNQGRPSLSNTFGAALWGIDFNLYAASVGFKRVHMHMGTNYRVSLFPIPPQTTPNNVPHPVRLLATNPHKPHHHRHQAPLLRQHSSSRHARQH